MRTKHFNVNNKILSNRKHTQHINSNTTRTGCLLRITTSIYIYI